MIIHRYGRGNSKCPRGHVIRLSVLLVVFVCGWAGASIAARASAQAKAADIVLAPGDPPLTQSMVDRRLAVWEGVLEIKISQEQRGQLQRLIVQAWKQGDKNEIQSTLADVKVYGKESEILAARAGNQSAFVESLRKASYDPVSRQLVEIYDAAHPERKDYMQTHGMGSLVGDWKTGGAMLANRNLYTGEAVGNTFADSMTFTIFSDGRFKHFWVHSHCDNGNTCCRKYGTDVSGSVSVVGGRLALKADSGTQLFNDPCHPAANLSGPIDPHQETFQWSIKRSGNSSTLCLASQPFHPWQNGPEQPVCYERH